MGKKTSLLILAVIVIGGALLITRGNRKVETPTPIEDNSSEKQAVTDADAKVFEISGKNFEFSQTEMRVSEGDTVKIIFTSESGFHDWVVDEFSAFTDQVQTGGVTEVTFVAGKAGTYEYYCSVGKHRALGMIGTLIVE